MPPANRISVFRSYFKRQGNITKLDWSTILIPALDPVDHDIDGQKLLFQHILYTTTRRREKESIIDMG